MFASLSSQSPPLAYFPASQRVTYLYYLGRYLFSNNLFFPAQIALQASYDQCHKLARQQRQSILTYLIPCNMIMGRFPSLALLQRPEYQGLAEQFVPICQLIVRGDYIAFRDYLAVDSPRTAWLARKGILLPLRDRCEILVWRSLGRKVFIHGGFHGEPQVQGQRVPPPFLYLSKLEIAVNWLQSQHAKKGKERQHIISKPPDWDFVGLPSSGSNNDGVGDVQQEYQDYLAPEGYFDEYGQWRENPTSALVDDLADADTDYSGYELDPYYAQQAQAWLSNGKSQSQSRDKPTAILREIESILASLLMQNLMRGYLTHNNPRFAIPGARLRGALPTGFPNVWRTIYAREREDDHVPGWVQLPQVGRNEGIGGGRVVNLQGARPVGVQ